jgi:hypothetical protein
VLKKCVVMLSLIGCAPPDVDICESVNSAGATLELFSARQTVNGFEPMAVQDGGELILWEGTQGGYHVWGAIRAFGLYPGTAAERMGTSTDGFARSPIAEYTLVTTSSQAEEAKQTFQKPLTPGASGAERLGDWVVLNSREGGRLAFLQLEGMEATYSAKVTDTCGTTIEDSLSVTLNLLTLEEQRDQ